jgi:hypothetical protein
VPPKTKSLVKNPSLSHDKHQPRHVLQGGLSDDTAYEVIWHAPNMRVKTGFNTIVTISNSCIIMIMIIIIIIIIISISIFVSLISSPI